MRWALRNAESEDVQRLALRIWAAHLDRTVTDGSRHTDSRTGAEISLTFLADLHSPGLMTGLRVAVDRLRAAIERGETVLIYGDYDVDGTTAIVILKTAHRTLRGKTEHHVPHRILEGYGMRDEVIEQAAERGIRVIISVDTGIGRSLLAKPHSAGASISSLPIIICRKPDGVPRALAVVNPNQEGCDYPCKSLCGAGVAFKIAQALLEETGRERLLPSFLKMVAIATIADAVPLLGENRVFAKLGLEGLRKPVNAGLRALLANCQLDGSRPLSAGDIAFRVAPRLNAAGRMDVAEHVIQLFTEKDATIAADIAIRLNQLNGDRQLGEQRIIEEIQRKVEASPEMREAYCLVLEGEGWHRGVIGICATRVVERYRRPTLIFACEEGEAYGSGRSIEAFHLLEALESCSELFTRFGGHAHAVGCSLPVQKIPELRSRLDAFARGTADARGLHPRPLLRRRNLA